MPDVTEENQEAENPGIANSVPPDAADAANANSRCGIVAIVGRASVGKSSLINRILGEKISIVSPVPQTTRNVVRGVHTEARGQLVFLDTPGVHKAEHDLGKLMNRMARVSIEGADVALLVLDGTSAPQDEDLGWMRKLLRAPCQLVLALNKADVSASHAAEYEEAWRQIEAAGTERRDARWVSISAQTGAGVDGLLGELFSLVPIGPALFAEDLLTDFPRRLAIADIIREKLFGVLHQELPHCIAVYVDELEEKEHGWEISAQVYVNKASQKGIVLGDKGRRLRRAREQAEVELQKIYERPMKLNLWVKVEPQWAKNFWILRQMGYT